MITFANMALPTSYYYGQSLFLLVSMLFFDAVIMILFLILINKKIFDYKVFISLLTVFVFGIIGDIVGIFFADLIYSRNCCISMSDFLGLDNFYSINTYMNNYLDSTNYYFIDANIAVVATTLFIASFFTILILNLTQKIILNISWKKILLLATMIAILTNPIWGLSVPLFVIWLVIVIYLFSEVIIYRKKHSQKT